MDKTTARGAQKTPVTTCTFAANGKKHQPMYVDTANGMVRIGTIYCYRNADWSHAPVQSWNQQDWVEVREVKARTVC